MQLGREQRLGDSEAAIQLLFSTVRAGDNFSSIQLREVFQYYFEGFVRKGGDFLLRSPVSEED